VKHVWNIDNQRDGSWLYFFLALFLLLFLLPCL
jgi:hypothetical protein